MASTNRQCDHLERRLHEERERTLQVLNGILADTSSPTEQDAAGDLSSDSISFPALVPATDAASTRTRCRPPDRRRDRER